MGEWELPQDALKLSVQTPLDPCPLTGSLGHDAAEAAANNELLGAESLNSGMREKITRMCLTIVFFRLGCLVFCFGLMLFGVTSSIGVPCFMFWAMQSQRNWRTLMLACLIWNVVYGAIVISGWLHVCQQFFSNQSLMQIIVENPADPLHATSISMCAWVDRSYVQSWMNCSSTLSTVSCEVMEGGLLTRWALPVLSPTFMATMAMGMYYSSNANDRLPLAIAITITMLLGMYVVNYFVMDFEFFFFDFLSPSIMLFSKDISSWYHMEFLKRRAFLQKSFASANFAGSLMSLGNDLAEQLAPDLEQAAAAARGIVELMPSSPHFTDQLQTYLQTLLWHGQACQVTWISAKKVLDDETVFRPLDSFEVDPIAEYFAPHSTNKDDYIAQRKEVRFAGRAQMVKAQIVGNFWMVASLVAVFAFDTLLEDEGVVVVGFKVLSFAGCYWFVIVQTAASLIDRSETWRSRLAVWFSPDLFLFAGCIYVQVFVDSEGRNASLVEKVFRSPYIFCGLPFAIYFELSWAFKTWLQDVATTIVATAIVAIMVAQCGFDQDSVRYHSTSPNPVISYHGSASFLTCIAAFTVKHVYQSYIVEIILRSSFKLEVLEKFNRVHACRVGMRDTCFDATVDLIDDLQQMSVDEFKEQQHGILMCERLHHNFKWQLYYASRGIINAALLDQRIVPSLLLTNLVPMQVFFAEIETAFETHPSKHPELRLKLESCEQIPPHVLTYEQFAHFGLRQLISNSVKFNAGAGKVVLRTRVIHAFHKHFLRFEVIDQGEGLPESLADCSKLFTQFGTMSHRREVTGLGLGLWSIKEVLAHFGEGARCGFRRVKRTFKRKSLSCFWFQVPFEMSRESFTRD